MYPIQLRIPPIIRLIRMNVRAESMRKTTTHSIHANVLIDFEYAYAVRFQLMFIEL